MNIVKYYNILKEHSSKIILIYWFAAQETFPIIIDVENCSAA